MTALFLSLSTFSRSPPFPTKHSIISEHQNSPSDISELHQTRQSKDFKALCLATTIRCYRKRKLWNCGMFGKVPCSTYCCRYQELLNRRPQFFFFTFCVSPSRLCKFCFLDICRNLIVANHRWLLCSALCRVTSSFNSFRFHKLPDQTFYVFLMTQKLPMVCLIFFKCRSSCFVYRWNCEMFGRVHFLSFEIHSCT